MLIPFVSILPVILYLIVLKLLDSFSLVRWNKLLICLGYGVLCCLVLFLLPRFVRIPEVKGISIYPLFEEVLKGLIMVYLVRSNKIRFLAETLIYGASVGGGFALLENIIYFTSNPDMMLGTAIFRGFGCAFLHIGCTSMIATVLLLTKEKIPAVFTPAAYLPSIVLHFLHNQLSVAPSLKLVITIAVFFILFIFLFNLGEKKVYGWMDHSISVDIQTLSSIRSGNFSATKAGEYLLNVKEQFLPEVFFDMINYVELYLEIKIEKQRNMLLSQAGFDIEDAGGQNSDFNSKLAELESLRKFIGKTGYQVLSPLVRDNI